VSPAANSTSKKTMGRLAKNSLILRKLLSIDAVLPHNLHQLALSNADSTPNSKVAAAKSSNSNLNEEEKKQKPEETKSTRVEPAVKEELKNVIDELKSRSKSKSIENLSSASTNKNSTIDHHIDELECDDDALKKILVLL
jgi:hypothetical protein